MNSMLGFLPLYEWKSASLVVHEKDCQQRTHPTNKAPGVTNAVACALYPSTQVQVVQLNTYQHSIITSF